MDKVIVVEKVEKVIKVEKKQKKLQEKNINDQFFRKYYEKLMKLSSLFSI